MPEFSPVDTLFQIAGGHVDKAGFRLEREIKAPGISILEATPSS